MCRYVHEILLNVLLIAFRESWTHLQLMRGGMHTDKHPFLCVIWYLLTYIQQAMKYEQVNCETSNQGLSTERSRLKLNVFYSHIPVDCTRLDGLGVTSISQLVKGSNLQIDKTCPSGATTSTP